MENYPFVPIVVENIVQNLSAGLLVIDPGGRIGYANQTVCTILGYPAALISGKSWAEVFFVTGRPSDSNDDFNQVLIDTITEKKVGIKHMVQYTRPSGECLFLSITASFVRDESLSAGVVILIDDLTEIHRLHERERVALGEKHRIEKERSEGLNQFAMAVAHQIRNPVMSIGGFARRLRGSFDPETVESQYVDHILSGAQRLEGLVQAVSEYTSCHRGELVECSLSAIMEGLRTQLEESARRLAKSIEWSIRCGPERIDADRQLFRRALYEIGLNAIEFCPREDVHLSIAAKPCRSTLCLTISDSGPGIDEKHIPFVFDPFFSTKALGVGMGLCKAKAIVAGHGGSIRLESRVGEGTSVTIHLPRQDCGCHES